MAVDLNAIYRLMRPEWAENEPEPFTGATAFFQLAIDPRLRGPALTGPTDAAREFPRAPAAMHGNASATAEPGSVLHAL
eukprot:COSAG04_NODE_6312_length_1358_cov_0.728356_1_plen_78_part_10